jgi:hypothetical protein
MDTDVQGILFAIAVVCFVLAAIGWPKGVPINLVAAGLAFFAFVFAYNAFDAA